MNKTSLVFVLAIIGAALGWMFGAQQLDRESPQIDSEIMRTLPTEPWANLDGGQNSLDEWLGKVLIINHWATWCEPCRREIPMFMDIRSQHADQGLELIGIAHDDEESVRLYVDSMGMDYPQLLAGLGQGQKWMVQLGNNGSLPLTLVYDREGQLRARKIGLMSEKELNQAIAPLL